MASGLGVLRILLAGGVMSPATYPEGRAEGRVFEGVPDLAAGALLGAFFRAELSMFVRHLLKAVVSEAAFGVAKLERLAKAWFPSD